MFEPAEVTPGFAQFPAWLSLRPSQLRASAAESGLMIPCASGLAKRYHELSMPLVIMAGADDRIVDAHEQSKRLHRLLPHSELHLARGIGHMIHHSMPQQVMDAIDSAARLDEPFTAPEAQAERVPGHLH